MADDIDTTAETVSYRADNYDDLDKPVERPTGEAGPSETVEHRSHDYDDLVASGALVGTVPVDGKSFRDKVETKPVTTDDPGVETK